MLLGFQGKKKGFQVQMSLENTVLNTVTQVPLL